MEKMLTLVDAINKNDRPTVNRLIDEDPSLVNSKDGSGATPLHYAAMCGNREIALLLLQRGAAINVTDDQYGATPSGWAIELYREHGGFLALELADLAHAIRMKDAHWVARFVTRFPALKKAVSLKGKPFTQLAAESGDEEIKKIFL